MLDELGRRGVGRLMVDRGGTIHTRTEGTRVKVQQDSSTTTDHFWMQRAIDLSRLCPPAEKAFSVGAVIVAADGTEMAHGYSRESDTHVHAEESALAKLRADDPRLKDATTYSTLEPCSERRSARPTCVELIIAAGIPRIVIAWREPSLFVDDCIGVELLVAAGRTVVEIPELAAAVRAVNVHLPVP